MNRAEIERVAELEWANYAATEDLVKVTPASNLVLRDDVIMTSARLFPTSELNHACLLRATPDTAEPLIEEIIDHFKSRRLPVYVFISPACQPADLAERLLERGFQEREKEEIWVVLDNLPTWQGPAVPSQVTVKQVTKREAWALARVYLASFKMSAIFTPFMTLLLRSSMGLPNIHYYLAYVDDKPVGTCLWYFYQGVACFGAAGVLPSHRGMGVATGMAVTAITDAQKQGMDTFLCQTLNPGLEQVLCKNKFKRAFARTCYTL